MTSVGGAPVRVEATRGCQVASLWVARAQYLFSNKWIAPRTSRRERAPAARSIGIPQRSSSSIDNGPVSRRYRSIVRSSSSRWRGPESFRGMRKPITNKGPGNSWAGGHGRVSPFIGWFYSSNNAENSWKSVYEFTALSRRPIRNQG